MPFCTSCGAQIRGHFCESCGAGAPANTGSPAAAPQMQPVAAAPAAAQPHKSHVLLWILGGFAVLMLLFVGALTVGGIFLFHKAKQAGLDPELWQRNPGLAATKMLAAANPDAEIVSIDERGGVVVVRDRKTGKTIRMNFADIKSGRMSLEGDDGEKVSIAATGNGDAGAIEVHSKDGTARFAAGSSMQLPSWIPAYAGAKDPGGISTSGPNGVSGTYGFKTADSAATVIGYYEAALRKEGFTIREKLATGDTNVLAGEDGSNTVNVAASADNGQTGVSISFAPKGR